MEVTEKKIKETVSKAETKLKILVVEDDAPSRKVMEGYLEEYGECDTAADGVEGIELFKKASEEGHGYDLVCLDIEMPNMNGQQALKAIRQIEQDKGVFEPNGVNVIMTTGNDRSRDMIEAFDWGCASYIVKPVEQVKLVAELQKLGLVSQN